MSGGDSAIAVFGALLGEWFASSLGRTPTREEIAIVCSEVQALPNPCNDTDVAAAMERAAGRLGVKSVIPSNWQMLGFRQRHHVPTSQ